MYHTQLRVICNSDFSEILMAEVAEAGFETFMEIENGFEAYVENDRYDAAQLNHIQTKYEHVSPLTFQLDKIQKQNWNEAWEKTLEPIIVDDKCLVRAEFHKIIKKYPYEIIITPKMSFGTGHHQTTYLMLRGQMKIKHQGKRVMDAGCGTAILSIMASKLGATAVESFDIDEWSVINGKENAENNGYKNINIQQGKITEVHLRGKFDIILANINKNILLAEMEHYARFLEKDGQLLLSGFYTADIADIKKTAGQFGLEESLRDEKETWATLLLQKK